MEVCQDCKPACNTVTPEPSTIQYSISLLSKENLSQAFEFFLRGWPMSEVVDQTTSANMVLKPTQAKITSTCLKLKNYNFSLPWYFQHLIRLLSSNKPQPTILVYHLRISTHVFPPRNFQLTLAFRSILSDCGGAGKVNHILKSLRMPYEKLFSKELCKTYEKSLKLIKFWVQQINLFNTLGCSYWKHLFWV